MLDPLTIERMQAAAGDGPIVVALSGGGDSVALLHLLTERLGAARLRAAIVDHKLREGSDRDARAAAEFAQAAGVEAHVLELSWPQSSSRAHETARALRYAALCAQARKLGARVIAVGHTRDDQAETVLLRAARGSGLRGLAGMRGYAPAPLWPEGRALRLARPLLSARRNELRAYLTTRGASWLEDPANESEIYARVRARHVLTRVQREGLDPMRFAVLAERLQPLAHRIDEQAAALIAEAAEFEEAEVVLDLQIWRGAEKVKQRALDALITAVSGEARGPSQIQLESLSDALKRAEFSGATLGGAWLQARGARIVIRRDPGALTGRAGGAGPLPPLPLRMGEETIWDGRVALNADESGWSVVFDGKAPLLQRGEERRALAAASPHWLLRERVRHVLGMD